MPLSILVPMIMVGLPLVIGLVYYVNKNKKHTSLTPELASSLLQADFAELNVKSVVIDDTASTAVVSTDDNDKIGLIAAMGQNFITRIGEPGFIKSVDETETGISIRTNDFTLRQIRLEFSDHETRQKILGALRFQEM